MSQDVDQGCPVVPAASAQAGHPRGHSRFPARSGRGSGCHADILPGHWLCVQLQY